MNHSFSPSIADASLCVHCKKNEIAHTDDAVCEACTIVGPVDLVYGNMLMCKSCQDKEKKAYAEAMKPENQQARVEAANTTMSENLTIKKAQAIDDAVKVRSDIFNNETIAIVDIEKAIVLDESVANKPYKLAEVLKLRFEHYTEVIFELNEKVAEANTRQKAIQVYLNNLANKLRSEEREKLKISDINYQPKALKPVKVPKAGKKKLDKAELKKYSVELGIPEYTIQMLCVSKGLSVEQVADMLRKSIAQAKGV